MFFGTSPDRRRRRRLAQAAPGPVHDYLAVPFPDLGTRLDELPMMAIDLETTGLDPEKDRILSIGYVPIDNGEIRLAGARECIITSDGEVGDSATVHGITDDALVEGVPLRESLIRVLDAMQGRVLLAHHARIEVEFLQAACKAEFGTQPEFIVVDTLLMAQDYVGLDAAKPGKLRLFSLRDRFRLPRYKAHNALIDAMACGELYLALTAEMGMTTLKQVYAR